MYYEYRLILNLEGFVKDEKQQQCSKNVWYQLLLHVFAWKVELVSIHIAHLCEYLHSV